MKSIYEFLINNHIKPTEKDNTPIVYATATYQEFFDLVEEYQKEYNALGIGVTTVNFQKYNELIQNYANLFDKTSLKELKRFLKGKNYYSGIYIHFNAGVILQVSRYDDNHRIKLAVIQSDNFTWGTSEDWTDAVELDSLDNRSSMDDLFFAFINDLYNKLK